MKKNRISLFLLSLFASFVFVLSGCADQPQPSTQFKADTKLLLAQKIGEMASYVGGDFEEAVIDDITPIANEVADSLLKAKITDEELNKLLALNFVFESENEYFTQNEFLTFYRQCIDQVYATGVTNTKIAKFAWHMFNAGRRIVTLFPDDLFYPESKQEVLADYDLALTCFDEESFVSVFSALLDSHVIGLDFEMQLIDFLSSNAMPTSSEMKAVVKAAREYAVSYDKIWNDKTALAVQTIVTKVMSAFAPNDETASMLEEALSQLAPSIRVYCKSQVALFNAIDDQMIDIICGEEPEDPEKTIIFIAGKLAASVVDLTGKGTGLTPQFAASNPLAIMLFIDFAGYIDFSVESFTELFTDIKAFTALSYDAPAPSNNLFYEIMSDILTGGAPGSVQPY